MIAFTRDKRFGQVETGHKKMESDKTIGLSWKDSNPVLATIQRDCYMASVQP